MTRITESLERFPQIIKYRHFIVLLLTVICLTSPSLQSSTTSTTTTTTVTGGSSTTTTTSTTSVTGSTTTTESVVNLDSDISCYCPGSSDLGTGKFSVPQLKKIFSSLDEMRREEQQNFTVNVLPTAAPVVERSRLPSAEVLSIMFPDLGDGFDIDTWLASLSQITYAAVKEIKNTTKNNMAARLAAAATIKAEMSTFDYSNFTVAPTPAPAESSTTSTTTTTTTTTTAGGDQGRRKREGAPTTTTEVPSRVDVVYAIPHQTGFGIKKGNSSLLEDAEGCYTCGDPGKRRRKFLYLSTVFDDNLLDVSTVEFKTKKKAIETEIDTTFYNWMFADESRINTGYWGSNVLSMFKSISSQRGAGRKKRFVDGGTGVELELTFRADTITDSEIEQILDTGTVTDMVGDSKLNASECEESALDYDKNYFQLESSGTGKVPVGEKAYLRCMTGYVMDRTYDTTLMGLPITCGNKGQWEMEYDLYSISPCTKTPMCGKPLDASPSGDLLLLPYSPIDHLGSVMGAEYVYYKCKDDNMMLDDNSGTAVFELYCDVTDPDHPKMLESSSWPTCVSSPRCTVIPEPSSEAASSGMVRDVADTRESLLPGELVIYNCTDPTKPVTNTGSYLALECSNGEIKSPPWWPVCRAKSGCDSTPAGLPVPPAGTFLAPIVPTVPVMELDRVNYSCTLNVNKTYLPLATYGNLLGLMCLPGGQWEVPATDGDWPSCQDPTTTTPAPTTSLPPRKKPCYCLGDVDKVSYDPFVMNKDRHKSILKVCRNAWVTFHKNMYAKDETGAYNLLPIKEQCGVVDPYVSQYGALVGTMRDYTYHDTCACVKNPQDTKALAVEVVGYWMEVEMLSLTYDRPNMMIKILPGRTDPQLPKKGNITAKIIEELFDDLFIDEANLVKERFIRTRFIKFVEGDVVMNQADIDEDETIEEEFSTRVVMEVQFARPADKSIISLEKFTDVARAALEKNDTMSITPMPYFQTVNEEFNYGIIINSNCSDSQLSYCFIKEAPACVNKDFAKIPDDLVFRHKNMTKMSYPYNVTRGGETKEYVGRVGETLDFVCKADHKVFKTEIQELMDSVLTVVCKTDRFYTVPSSGNWPVCKAQCNNQVVIDKVPTPETKLMLWDEHPDMVGVLDSLFWEDQKVWYKCIDEKNEGIILEAAKPGQVQYGDKKRTFLEYQCLETGEFNLPIKKFPGCAPKPDTCECLGDLTPEQSLTILDMICYEDAYLEGNYHFANHTDTEKVGLVLIANKTRCGVKKPDYPSLDDKCYCLEKFPGSDRRLKGEGVKNGFWHKMEVLSLPWHEDLFWPNTSMFKDAKALIERELDTMYISNSSLIFGHKYVRSVVMKFIKGQYRMQHLTSTTSTTTTTTTTSTTTTKPLRVGREVPDMMRDYFYDFSGEKTWRDDKKVFVGARGYWPYDGTETMSTQAWVEHQFVGEFSVQEFNALDFVDEHARLLEDRNGQWMDESLNTSLWLSQGCYVSEKCVVEDMQRCENVILDNLPFGFVSLKSKAQVQVERDQDYSVEYKTPIGGSVDIVCKQTFQRITVDEWDLDPNDMKMTVMCLPTYKYDIPRDNFPKCKSYCPKPFDLWNKTTMANFGPLTDNELPLQMGVPPPKYNPWDPQVGYLQLEPDNYTDLTLDTMQSDYFTELWDGERLFFTCKNTTLGVEEAASPVVAFKCKSDGTYAVPKSDEWPICKIRTTTAKPPIVRAVKFSMKIADDTLTNNVLYADYLAAKNIGDKNLWVSVTIPTLIFLVLFVMGCLFFTRNDSICCQVCNRDFEIKQMQNYGHDDYTYN